MSTSVNHPEPTTESAPPALSEADTARLNKWRAHLAERGTTIPEEEDFRTFGKLSTLERLRRTLDIVTPEHCGPLRGVICDLRRQKRRGTSGSTGGPRGPAMTLSVPKESLRADWRETLADMRARSARREAGLLIFEGPQPPAASMIRDVEYVLCALSKACIDVGMDPSLKRETIRVWLDREEGRGRRATGLSLQLRLLRAFLAYRKEKPKLRKRLKRMASEYARRGRRRQKRKHAWVNEHRITIGDLWETAEELFDESRRLGAGTTRRYQMALHAAAIALSVNMPLRIGDLHRLRFGLELIRSSEGWSVSTDIRKTDDEYEIPWLWPETTKFLDELLVLDAAGGELWSEYDRRAGTPVFSQNGGLTGLSADWISDVFYEHIGTGQHIIRTLWHQMAYESDEDIAWVVESLCGQSGTRTKREYRERNARGKAVRAGRKSLADKRKRDIVASRAGHASR